MFVLLLFGLFPLAPAQTVGIDNEVVDLRDRESVEKVREDIRLKDVRCCSSHIEHVDSWQAILGLYAKLNETIRQLRQFENDAATAKDYKSAAKFQAHKVPIIVWMGVYYVYNLNVVDAMSQRALSAIVDTYFKNR